MSIGAKLPYNILGVKLLSRVFRREFAGEWLILSGPAPALGKQALERLLELVEPGSGILLVSPGGKIPEGLEGWIDDLGGLLDLDVTTAPMDSSAKDLAPLARRAGLLIAAGVEARPDLEQLLDGYEAWVDLVQDFPGLILWLMGSTGLMAGEWCFNHAEEVCMPGSGWLPGCVLLGESDDHSQLEPIQTLLRNRRMSYALKLVGSATLALGPGGEIDLWGEPAPTIVLGSGWSDV